MGNGYVKDLLKGSTIANLVHTVERLDLGTCLVREEGATVL